MDGAATADWHERETAEMFGITFNNHPDPRKLLLPDGWTVHPLRKDFSLYGTEEDTPDLPA
jgi:NADH-quinone oxidoreductase subunit C